MPAVSQAQRAYLAAHFGPEWLRAHHFNNPGPLPAHAHQETPVSSILSSILGQAAPAGGHGLPPDLAAAISGSAPDSGQAEKNAVQLLDEIIKGLNQYLQVEPDEEDKVVATTCLTNLQKLKAKDQSEADKAMQGSTSPRMVRKAAAAQGGGPGGGY